MEQFPSYLTPHCINLIGVVGQSVIVVVLRRPHRLDSKLPAFGGSIHAVMSRMVDYRLALNRPQSNVHFAVSTASK